MPLLPLDPAGVALLGALAPLLGAGRRRVHLVSGSYGAGHDAAADEVARRLTAVGHRVVRWDVVDLLPLGLGRLARWVYLRQLSLAPESWETTLRRVGPSTRTYRLVRSVLRRAGGRLVRRARRADLFVATHPFAGQMLGELRARDALRAPAVTYLTDASVHALWVHPQVDLHLGLHPVAVEQARRLGGRAEAILPLVPDSYAAHRLLPSSARDAVRARLGLTRQHTMVLVVGGSLGVGDLVQVAQDVRDTRLAVPVVACGRNDGLRRRLAAVPGVVALGWRDDLPDLVQSADCVVHNAGGFTTWEALAAGTPVLTYRPLPGHGRANAAALQQAGLAAWATSRDDLLRLLREVLEPTAEASPVLEVVT